MKSALSFVALSLIAAPLTVFSTDAQARDRVVNVSGTCIRSVTPDRGMVTITAEFKDMDVKKATTLATQQYEKVRDRVVRLKLEDEELSTSEYRVDEIREWENNKNVFKGYRARIGLRVVTSNQKRLGEVIEIASKEGVRDVGGLSLFTSSKLARAERNECLKEASEQAKSKAQKLAESLGAKLGEVIQIDESANAMLPSPMPIYAKSMMADQESVRGGAPTIEAGKEEIQASVSVVFGLR